MLIWIQNAFSSRNPTGELVKFDLEWYSDAISKNNNNNNNTVAPCNP